MVQVDDEPNVRRAHRRVEPGMVVSPQGVWPSLEYDVKSANRAFGRFLSVGFYYKTFIKPRRLSRGDGGGGRGRKSGGASLAGRGRVRARRPSTLGGRAGCLARTA